MIDIQLKAEAAAEGKQKFKESTTQDEPKAGADKKTEARNGRSATTLAYSRSSIELEGQVDNMKEQAKTSTAGREKVSILDLCECSQAMRR